MRSLPLLLALSFSAVSAPVTVKHAAGETVVQAPAQRVVALGPHALDLLLSLGVQPVGYGEAAQLGVTDYGSPVRQIRYLGSRVTGQPLNVGDRFRPNLEVVTSLRPDLIVGEDYFLDIQLFGRLRGPIAEELMLRELGRQLR